MSIVKSNAKGSIRHSRLEGLAGAALISAAVFVAAPKAAHGEVDYTATGDQSWFNTANWMESTGSTTGTLPEVYVANGVTNASNIDANNASMPSVGVLFDPANDAATPGGKNANYTAQMGQAGPGGAATLYLSNSTAFTDFTHAAPNKLTIESGTIETGVVTDGRDGNGIIVLNGGTFITDQKLAIQGDNHTVTIGSGTFEYHGGTYIAGNQVQVASGQGTSTLAGSIGNTSAGVGRFVVYNDGPDGAVLISNGISFATNTNTKGTIGIVEFHYDLNNENIGNVRPVQDNFNTTNGQLKLDNATNTSTRLNLVLDAAPSVIGGNVQNLGLFKTQSITGSGTFPKLFYTLADGTVAYTQGATISATFASTNYSWTISYSGLITFDNSGTSAYSSSDISTAGAAGNDVVLIGLPSGNNIPEPASMALLGGAGSMIMARRRQRITKKS
jgi:hypothetical protein